LSLSLSQYQEFNCLFLVPSIALVKQALVEWTQQSDFLVNYICVCSDSTASKMGDDEVVNRLEDLSFPATTNVNSLIRSYKKICFRNKNYINNSNNKKILNVIFSTYQSIDIVSQFQEKINKENKEDFIFDLIVCDEAHRTTGAKLTDKDESNFIKVHNNDFIQAHKRMYMTATPRIYTDDAKKKAEQMNNITLCSMDDEELYGEEFYKINFGEAVDLQLLSDYRVFVLTLNEEDYIDDALKEKILELAKEDIKDIKKIKEETIIENTVKLIGSVNALSKKCLTEEDNEFIQQTDPDSMKKGVIFCNTIENSKIITKTLKKWDEIFKVAKSQNELVVDVKNEDDEIQDDEMGNSGVGGDEVEDINKVENKENKNNKENELILDAEHIDGSFSLTERHKIMEWLKNSNKEGKCNLLTNVKCLSEGIDVPSLDVIVFLSSKNSKIDIVQSVGRVMRKADGKKYGYIVVPVVIPKGKTVEEEMNKKDGAYKIVWDVLSALKSHDDRFLSEVNKINLGTSNENKNKFKGTIFTNKIDLNKEVGQELELSFADKIKEMLYVRLADKNYWQKYSEDIAKVAEENINRIRVLLKENEKIKREFDKFLSKLHKDINSQVTENEAVEMLSQHLIMKPIFEILFNNDVEFVNKNAITKMMYGIVKILTEECKDINDKLELYYESTKRQIKEINTKEEKQSFIKTLYNNFFNKIFKSTTEKLGIVYTPIEIVDFIIHSVNDVLKKEFGKTLTDKGINILDPFTGTGTFITRLLHSGIIKQEDLERKYKKEIFANEIVPLAYYVACANIENEYLSLSDTNKYISFNGLCLTDTFQMYETEEEHNTKEDMDFLNDIGNTERIIRQKKQPINIIISNPPYSAGQKSANDNNQNQHYEKLEKKIADTYVKYSKAQKSSMYDSYIKSFRWASDRINKETGGIIGFITNSGWLDSGSADGFRCCLTKEFDSIYVIDLKGNIRKFNKTEGENVFDIMVGVAITILVKKPEKDMETSQKKDADIYYYNIGDYLNKKEKIEKLKNLKSILNIINTEEAENVIQIQPNKHNDWLTQRSDIFENKNFIPIEPLKKYDANTSSFFINYSCGISTARDVWCYNFSKNELKKNIHTTIDYYNQQRIEVNEYNNTLIKDSSKCNWTGEWDKYLKNNKVIFEDINSYRTAMYRPFVKQNVYFNEYLNERRFQMPAIFPMNKYDNLCICMNGIGDSKDFSVFITNIITDYHVYGITQCFPLYYYTKNEKATQYELNYGKDGESKEEYIKHNGISDYILKKCKEKYGENVNKEDIFYYVYGILNSEDYKKQFQDDLKRVLPRIPLVDEFWVFSKVGRELADLHLNYESIEACSQCKVVKTAENYYVNKMSFGKDKDGNKDKSVIVYNNFIKIENVPEKAYKYIINGKSAIEWIMDKYKIDIDKKSGLKNDPNLWCDEFGNEKYIFDLLLSVIEVSIKSVDLIESLPRLSFDEYL
ncbi:MAG: DEAD/DEAH box helicase, partial [Rickettsiales bacterium]|nr:DEAD/DEAH box helicase [Rickettsiales bacterium]